MSSTSNQSKDKDDMTSTSTIKKSTAVNQTVILGCLVCIVTTIVVAGIAVPVSKNSVQCAECEQQNTCPNPAADSIAAKAVTDNPPVERVTIANTQYGNVTGHVVDMGTGNQWDNCMSYLGVRFAKENPGRWERPELPEVFAGDYIAGRQRTMCPQGGGILRLTGQTAWKDFGEDCLFMNVFSPVDAANGPYPVMLYFYGGAYQAGGTLQYPGHSLVQKGVVVAVINYRLGIFGFASTGDGYLKGNYALWDQRMAMLYVRDNIAAYGGDPNKVTIFGQSAGASSSGLHLISPNTTGLFHQALLQSGNELTFWAINTPANKPETYLPQVAERAGCDSSQPTEQWVNCLKNLTESELRSNNRFDCNFCLGFAPTIDGEFVPKHPYEILEEGTHNNVSVMLGSNTGECNLYVFGDYPWTVPERRGWNRTSYQHEVAKLVDWFSYLITEPDYSPEDAYGLFNWYYAPWPHIEDLTANKETLGQMCTDGAWTAGTAQVAKMRSRHGAKIYQYTNGISPAPHFPPIPGWIQRGIPHEFEVPFIWGYPTVYFGTDALRNDSENLQVPIACWSPEDVAFVEFFQTLWTNFAKYGDPTPEPIQHPFMDETVSWLPYDNEDYHYFYMDNKKAGTEKNFRLREAALFNEYVLNMGMGLMANPDDVQFVPYPYSVGGASAQENNKAPKRSRRETLENNPYTQMFREGMSDSKLMDVMEAPDGPIWEIIKAVVGPMLNETIVKNTNYTLGQIIDFFKDDFSDTICYERVMPWYKQKVIDLLSDIFPSGPPNLPTLPGGLPGLPTGRPTLPPQNKKH